MSEMKRKTLPKKKKKSSSSRKRKNSLSLSSSSDAISSEQIEYSIPSTTRQTVPTKKSRASGSLVVLTKKSQFLQHVQEADGDLDLNAIATSMNVSKRRLYDITNVLEGVNLLTRSKKNAYQWVGSDTTSLQRNEEDAALLQSLIDGESEIDEELLRLNEELASLGANSLSASYAYVLHEDLRQVFPDDVLLAIDAPADTLLEVADPDYGAQMGQRLYQFRLDNPQGNPIYARLVNDTQDAPSTESGEQEQQQSLEPRAPRPILIEEPSSPPPINSPSDIVFDSPAYDSPVTPQLVSQIPQFDFGDFSPTDISEHCSFSFQSDNIFSLYSQL